MRSLLTVGVPMIMSGLAIAGLTFYVKVVVTVISLVWGLW